jgi:hypothetical protein
MILRKSCPLRGLKMKIAPLMGLVVRLPSNVLWMVTLLVGDGASDFALKSELYSAAVIWKIKRLKHSKYAATAAAPTPRN